MTKTLTLFGATGYTGQLIAHALDRRGLAFRLAGRSAERLAALSWSLESHPPTLVADVHSPNSLPALFDHTRLLINCAGPFTDLGEPVVALAAEHGVHYLDITNELAYVRRVQKYDERARRTGAALVPACGFEAAISDCAAALLSREVADEIAVTYYLGGAGTSIGTRLSALRILATSWLAHRDGKLVAQGPRAALRRGSIDGRPHTAITFPSAELVTVPAHCRVQKVRVWMVVPRRYARLMAIMTPMVSGLLRTPLGWVAAEVVKRSAPPPDGAARAQSRFAIKVEVTREGTTQAQVWSGRDPYGLTAEIAAYAAAVMTAPDFSRAGVLAPSQALPPEPFLRWLRQQPDLAVGGEG